MAQKKGHPATNSRTPPGFTVIGHAFSKSFLHSLGRYGASAHSAGSLLSAENSAMKKHQSLAPRGFHPSSEESKHLVSDKCDREK